ncbi:hypothetical protein PHMEG_00010258 [Phytophthora megakarya]|uniref:Uncharacterized protein n=1 Tax=Phytophthora megakarya TaxID=4795 RepID=A0A225WE40_9STRA|nr:hypothetical protein PHMEG_00010258 [Phytophthora megakarya]
MYNSNEDAFSDGKPPARATDSPHLGQMEAQELNDDAWKRAPTTESQSTQSGQNQEQETDLASAADQYGSQTAWDPDQWTGDLDDILQRLEGPAIHHELKREIIYILQVVNARTGELLHFLVETVSRLSRYEQNQLMAADLAISEQREALMAKYQIPEPVVSQWQNSIQNNLLDQRSDVEDEESPASEQVSSGSEYIPLASTDDSSIVSPPRKPQRLLAAPRGPTKAFQVGEHNILRDSEEHDSLSSTGDPTQDLAAKFDAAAMPGMPTSSEDAPSWDEIWNSMESLWTKPTVIAFPSVAAPLDVWKKSVAREPSRLRHLLRSFTTILSS